MNELPEDIIRTAKTRAAQLGERVNVILTGDGIYCFFSDSFLNERGALAGEHVLATAEPFSCTR